MPDIDESITEWINGMRHGDESSTQKIWERYFQQLVALAGKRLPTATKRVQDEEDIALSAFHSLYKGVSGGKFPSVDDRHNLWSLLVVITARKTNHAIRAALAKKRGAGKVVGEAFFEAAPDASPGIQEVLGREPSPEFATMVAEECERLLDSLPDDSFRRLVALKLEGFTNPEIASHLGCGKRTVERRLELIRKHWVQVMDSCETS